MNTGTTIRSLAWSAIGLAAALSIAACTTGATTTSAPSPAATEASEAPVTLPPISAVPSASGAVASPEASTPEATAQATAIATSIDPCNIVTTDEVNTLTGAHFSSGKAKTDTNNVKQCTYGQQGVVFMVTGAVAPDAATAKKNEADTKAELEAQAHNLPFKLTELPGFAPDTDAAVVEGSATVGGTKFSGVAIYVVRNTTFFALTDISTLGATPPTAAQMEDQAKVTLGRVP
jgi:ABC-type transport system substrate-binding protein